MKYSNKETDLTMKFINKVSPILRPYIRHYWITKGTLEKNESIILLPMDHIDIIIPLCGRFYFDNFDYISDADGIVFHGIRSKAFNLRQDGYVVCLGISFEPWGFYPFIQKPLIDYLNRVVVLSAEANKFSRAIKQSIELDNDTGTNISNLERILIEKLEHSPKHDEEIKVIKSFSSSDQTNVKSFCNAYNINRKRLERIFNKYVGISPKDFLNVRKFENASRDVMFNSDAKLTDIALNEDYYDQAHFTKDFKKYTDYNPTDFKKKKPALKSKFKFD